MVASAGAGMQKVRGYAIETQEQPPLFGNRPSRLSAARAIKAIGPISRLYSKEIGPDQ